MHLEWHSFFAMSTFDSSEVAIYAAAAAAAAGWMVDCLYLDWHPFNQAPARVRALP